MTTIIEYFDPARHGAIVRDFVTSTASDRFGFRQNQPSNEDWQHLLTHAEAVGGQYIAVQLSRDGVTGVVVPVVRSSPVFRNNAFLHLFGRPEASAIIKVVERLSEENMASFCQTLVATDALQAQQVLREAGGQPIEDESFMRAENRPRPALPKHRPDVVVRRAMAAEAPSLSRLHRDGFGLDIAYAPGRFEIGADQGGFVLVAASAETLVGYCEIEKSGSNWWIDGLVVSHEVRRSGIGTSLLRTALDRIPTGAAVFLSVSSRNAAATKLYEKFGFSEYRRERRYILLGQRSG